MVRILQFLWHGCWHNWEVFGKETSHYWAGNYEAGITRSYRFTTRPCKCTKCGRISYFKYQGDAS